MAFDSKREWVTELNALVMSTGTVHIASLYRCHGGRTHKDIRTGCAGPVFQEAMLRYVEDVVRPDRPLHDCQRSWGAVYWLEGS